MYNYTLSSSSTLDEGGWSKPHPVSGTSAKDPELIVQEAGSAPRPVLTSAEKSPPTLIRSSHRPARRQSLYWLSYLDTISMYKEVNKLLYIKVKFNFLISWANMVFQVTIFLELIVTVTTCKQKLVWWSTMYINQEQARNLWTVLSTYE
jgi:hypothetical protein